MFVTPGDNLAYIEEFLNGENTYIDGDIIRSSINGLVKVDWMNRVISVSPTRSLSLLREGNYIVGRIVNISGVFGYVKIFFASKDGKRWSKLKYPQMGVIYPPYRVSEVSKIYSIKDEVYGIIVSTKNRILHISIRNKEYGVVKSLCKYCGEAMHVIKHENRLYLKCGGCQNTELRKLSPLYGAGIIKKLLYNGHV